MWTSSCGYLCPGWESRAIDCSFLRRAVLIRVARDRKDPRSKPGLGIEYERSRFAPRPDAQPLERRVEVALHGTFGYGQRAGDPRIRESQNDHREDLFLTGGKNRF